MYNACYDQFYAGHKPEFHVAVGNFPIIHIRV